MNDCIHDRIVSLIYYYLLQTQITNIFSICVFQLDFSNLFFSFFRYWCLKESYAKSIGLGAKSNLKEFSFKVNTKTFQVGEIIDTTELYINGEKVKHKFHEYLLDQDHFVTIAINEKIVDKIPFQFITFDELMQNCIPLLTKDNTFVERYFTKIDR